MAQTGHESPALEPENGGKGGKEEDAFDGCKGDKPRSKRDIVVLDPSKAPVCLCLDGWDH